MNHLTRFFRGIVLTVGFLAAGCHQIDGVRGVVLPVFYGDATEYARGYSDAAFVDVSVGMPEENVRRRLGEPFREAWAYENSDDIKLFVSFSNDLVTDVLPRGSAQLSGQSRAQVFHAYGPPSEILYYYTRQKTPASYRLRVVIFREGRVSRKIAEYYYIRKPASRSAASAVAFVSSTHPTNAAPLCLAE